MGTYSESIGQSVKRHGLLASVLTAAAVLGLVFLYRFLKSSLDADFMRKLPRSFRSLTPAQD